MDAVAQKDKKVYHLLRSQSAYLSRLSNRKLPKTPDSDWKSFLLVTTGILTSQSTLSTLKCFVFNSSEQMSIRVTADSSTWIRLCKKCHSPTALTYYCSCADEPRACRERTSGRICRRVPMLPAKQKQKNVFNQRRLLKILHNAINWRPTWVLSRVVRKLGHVVYSTKFRKCRASVNKNLGVRINNLFAFGKWEGGDPQNLFDFPVAFFCDYFQETDCTSIQSDNVRRRCCLCFDRVSFVCSLPRANIAFICHPRVSILN